ncbi:MAG: hypothetical protein IJW46_01780 [Clostridia bacterium]|nr:hypothetical protein [Clostridia bacterium]
MQKVKIREGGAGVGVCGRLFKEAKHVKKQKNDITILKKQRFYKRKSKKGQV